MTASEAIEKRLKQIKMSKTELASRLETSKQNLSNKFHRDNFSVKELIQIGVVIGLQLAYLGDDRPLVIDNISESI